MTHATAVQTDRIQDSLKSCVKEGIVASVMIGILDYYLIPFGLFLNAGTREIGWLIAWPNLLAAFSQFFAVQAVSHVGSRLRLLVVGCVLQSCVLIFMSLLAFTQFSASVGILIALVAVFKVVGNLLGPAWGSLVSDYLPENLRGIYFGWRSKWVGLAGILGISFWGILLAQAKKFSSAWAFFAVFFGAALFRFLSSYYMSTMQDLPLSRSRESDFSFWTFIGRFRESNFVRFIFYVASITFATQIAVPYFSVYMLQELKFNYATYMSVHLAQVGMGMLAFPIWGRHADWVGNAKIIKATSFILPFLPLLWIFAHGPIQLILIEMFSGFIWSGFNLCTTNFIYDSVTPDKRVRCLGYFNLINGAAVFAGAALGGFLADKLPPLRGSSLLSLFLLSAVLRFAADFFLSRQFGEVRQKAQPVSSAQLFFSAVGLRPLTGENIEWEMLPAMRPFSLKRPIFGKGARRSA